MKALLIFGADVSLVNEQKKTPMDLAKENSYKPIIELLQFASDHNALLNSHISDPVDSDPNDEATTHNHAYTNPPRSKGDRVLCLDGSALKD